MERFSPKVLGRTLAFLSLLTGCADERLVQLSQEAVSVQAEQNRQVSRVVSDSCELQAQLQGERSALRSAWDDLDQEKEEVRNRDRSDVVWLSFLTAFTPFTVCLAVFGAVSVGFRLFASYRRQHAAWTREAGSIQ